MASVTEEMVLEAMRDVYDPEIPLNVVDLGLVYKLEVSDKGDVYIEMTMTAPGCPYHEFVTNDALEKISAATGLKEEKIDIQVVWFPPWSPEMMSEEGRKALGF